MHGRLHAKQGDRSGAQAIPPTIDPSLLAGAQGDRMMEIENLIRYTGLVVGLMKIEK